MSSYSEKPCRGCGRLFHIGTGKTEDPGTGKPLDMEPAPLSERGHAFCKVCADSAWGTTTNTRTDA